MIAVIGGSGLVELENMVESELIQCETPFSDRAVELHKGRIADNDVIFLQRHGIDHKLPPHLINYRANLWAIKNLGAEQVYAINAVGGISEMLPPGALAIPDQLIDYTCCRCSSFFDEKSELTGLENVGHVDFTQPFDANLRRKLLKSMREIATEDNQDIPFLVAGVYGCTQGPRLETAAEIRRLANDGCDMVGMTVMPEAILARELDLGYASLALSVNWAAGLVEDSISMAEIKKIVNSGGRLISRVISRAIIDG